MQKLIHEMAGPFHSNQSQPPVAQPDGFVAFEQCDKSPTMHEQQDSFFAVLSAPEGFGTDKD